MQNILPYFFLDRRWWYEGGQFRAEWAEEDSDDPWRVSRPVTHTED